MTDDKFILMNMDDERSKKISEVLGNKKCKQILNYLAEGDEASEQDIADALSLKLNTVEYNLKKLIDAGLVKKAKNFFWSKKGKKIPMYKIAKKHIIISPRNSRPNLNALKAVLPIIATLAILAIILALVLPPNYNFNNDGSIKKFSSMKELKAFLKEHSPRGNFISDTFGSIEKGMVAETASMDGAPSEDYSTTNIQVAGVDEADTLKNDGEYIYTITNNKVVIVRANPAENLDVLSEIEIEDSNLISLFLNEDKLVIIYSSNRILEGSDTRCAEDRCMPPEQYESKTGVNIYDISNREDPELENEILVSGSYNSARMIDNYVYLINNQYVRDEDLPIVYEDGNAKTIEASEIYYTDINDNSFQYTIVSGINIDDGEVSEEVIMTGRTSTVYVSEDNLYLVSYNWNFNEDSRSREGTTIINKIEIDEDNLEFVAEGHVPGRVLNQFSMDEFEENFRIATTISGYSDNVDTSTNNLYVLNENLDVIGDIEEIAPGESIYSVRFMGDRAYMVTFRHIDPLFVIDLSDPENPEVLGKLKIPGYSDYLQPFDETHLIGIGKEVDASIDADKIHTEGAVYYTAIQGVKLAIFDVSDVSHPVEMYKEVIGDRGTESLAASDHKAFLFDKARELLVIPITLAELEEGHPRNEQGEFTFQGAYVYHLNLEDGFALEGRITHYEENTDAFAKSGYYFRGDRDIERSLYIGNVLYTVSNRIIKANDLNDLGEISSVEISDAKSDQIYTTNGIMK